MPKQLFLQWKSLFDAKRRHVTCGKQQYARNRTNWFMQKIPTLFQYKLASTPYVGHKGLK
jgi:hypothetical protein